MKNTYVILIILKAVKDNTLEKVNQNAVVVTSCPWG